MAGIGYVYYTNSKQKTTSKVGITIKLTRFTIKPTRFTTNRKATSMGDLTVDRV